MRLLALMIALLPHAGLAADRVVSINLCTDQVAMMLAEQGQLVSVSRLARDPVSSSMADEAMAYPVNRGQAEEVFLLRPDVVLASPYSSRAAVDLLRRLGVRVAEIPPVLTLADVPEQILATGRAMGREAEAEAVVAQFRADLAALEPAPRGTAATYAPNGHTAAPETLADQIMALAGWRNVATGGVMPLERLVMEAPDLLILSQTYAGNSHAEESLAHPALRGFATARSGADWVCGTPHLLRAVAALSR